MLVVVTGAAGFIGRNLVERLVSDGREVVAIDRRDDLPAAAHRLVADLAAPDGSVGETLGAAGVVWHLAARSGVRTAGPEIEVARHLDNVVATENVLELTPPGTRVIVTSSSSVYGGSLRDGDNRACREDDALDPRGGYARSKVEVEGLCRARRHRGGKVSVARPFTVAGEGQREDMAISIWIRAALAGRPLRILGSPDRTRDVTDVRDVVEGLVRMAEVDRDLVVNLGTGVGRSLREMATTVASTVGAPLHVVTESASDEEVPATLADVSRCRTELGFVPRTDLQELVSRQLQAAVSQEVSDAAS